MRKLFAVPALLILSLSTLPAQQIAMGSYPILTANCSPIGITAGPDGALWFTEGYADKIGRITVAGVITEYPLQ